MSSLNKMHFIFKGISAKHLYVALVASLIITLLLSFSSLSATEGGLSVWAGSSVANTTPSRMTAAIIETRPLSNLIPLILHFSSVLGTAWTVMLYTSASTASQLNTSAAFQEFIRDGRVMIVMLPEEETFGSRDSVSAFLTKPWFWESLAPARKVLLFQADSIICANSPHRVDEYLQYDFIGAPIDSTIGAGHGFNGGLSLRNISMILDIIRHANWKAEKDGDPSIAHVEFEDQWFFKKMLERNGSVLPTEAVAKTFSVETLWGDKPLGYHQVNRWQHERMDEVLKWCPEYSIATTDTLKY